jgi:hypothetical protein
MNQGPRRISLTKKNGGKKSRETIPLTSRSGYVRGLPITSETLQKTFNNFCELVANNL